MSPSRSRVRELAWCQPSTLSAQATGRTRLARWRPLSAFLARVSLSCSAHLQLAAKQRRYFSAIGVSHSDAWAAIRDRNFSYVYDALRRGFPVNQRDKTSGRTMLHEAAAVGDAEICELLLDWPGCSKQARCLVGRDSAIHFAATGGNWRIIDMLCRYGADARELDKYRLTPMHMATTTAAVQHLMRFGADERDRDRFGRTPGMCADERGDAAVASLMAELVLMRLKQAQQKEQNKTVTAKKATVAREQRLAEAAVRDEIRAKKQRLRALKDDYAAWRLPDGSGKSRPKPSAAKAAADDASHKALLAKYDARARKAGRDATLRLFGSG